MLESDHSCRRFEVPVPGAARAIRDFKSKNGTRIINLLVPFCFPKFVHECAAMYHELRKAGTSLSMRFFPIVRRPRLDLQRHRQ